MGVQVLGIDKDLFADLTRDFNHDVRKALDIASQEFIADMLDRTEKGTDVNGKPFVPYSGSYKEQIEKYGKVRVGKKRYRSKALNPVNLLVTGKMLGSIKSRRLGQKGLKSVEVFMPASEAKKAQGIQFGNKFIKRKREFFAVSKKEGEKFFASFKRELRILKNDRRA